MSFNKITTLDGLKVCNILTVKAENLDFIRLCQWKLIIAMLGLVQGAT